MSAEAPEPQAKGMRPLVRDYTLIAVAALAIVFLILFVEGPGVWSLVPVVVALVGVFARWGGAPAAFLLTLALVMVGSNLHVSWGWGFRPGVSLDRPTGSVLTDVVLAMAVLAYVAAHMRLLTLTRHGVPPDRRRQSRPVAGRVVGRWMLPGESKRTAARGAAGELLVFLVAVPLFTIVAALLWVPLSLEESPYRAAMSDQLWQYFVALWAMFIVVSLAAAFLAYLGRARAGREESLLFLQDQVWAATRREQRRITRWLSWGRLKGQRKKEG